MRAISASVGGSQLSPSEEFGTPGGGD